MEILTTWLSGPFAILFDNLKSNISVRFEKMDKELFTLHDISHCESVEKMAKALASRGSKNLTDLERFILSCAAWTHDVGMNSEIARDFFAEMRNKIDQNEALKDRRREHHNISAWYIQKESKNIFKTIPNEYGNLENHIDKFIRTICIVIKYHRKIENIRECEPFRTIKGEIVNTELLSAILRLSDTLHIDSTRIDPNMYGMLQIGSYDRASRLHWLKSFFVSNIHLNAVNQTITIDLDVPDFIAIPQYNNAMSLDQIDIEKRSWNERLKNLEYIISSDIQEELSVINEIFSKHGMPTYVNVVISRSVMPGFRKENYEELKGLLSELDILFSPNTSKVIRRTLESLKTFTEKRYDSATDFKAQFDQLRHYLREIHRSRTCHVALFKINTLLKEISSINAPPEKKKEMIREITLDIENARIEANRKIATKVGDIIKNNIKNIILFGFSSTVVNLVAEYIKNFNPATRQINIFILEGATKRRLTHSNQIEYNDGIHYAEEISKYGVYIVHIIPDAGLATLLNSFDKVKSQKLVNANNSVVLIGANGIDENDGTCGHTSGHLGVAIIAKEFNIPVKVISDSFKVGRIKWDPTAPRETEWLTTQLNLIDKFKNNKIRMLNYREEHIPIKYISEIYSEIGCVHCSNVKGEIFIKEFSKLKGEAKKYFEKLSKKLKNLSDGTNPDN